MTERSRCASTKFKFSVGPWNVHEGADAYGPATRSTISIEEKFKKFAELGFSAVQFHDDDAVPNINDYTEEEIKEKARELKKTLDKYNLKAEFVAHACGWTPIPSTAAI